MGFFSVPWFRSQNGWRKTLRCSMGEMLPAPSPPYSVFKSNAKVESGSQVVGRKHAPHITGWSTGGLPFPHWPNLGQFPSVGPLGAPVPAGRAGSHLLSSPLLTHHQLPLWKLGAAAPLHDTHLYLKTLALAISSIWNVLLPGLCIARFFSWFRSSYKYHLIREMPDHSSCYLVSYLYIIFTL